MNVSRTPCEGFRPLANDRICITFTGVTRVVWTIPLEAFGIAKASVRSGMDSSRCVSIAPALEPSAIEIYYVCTSMGGLTVDPQHLP